MAFNFWDWEKDKELKGIFVGQYKSVGRFKRNVFCFRAGKKIVHVWALVQLNNLLRDVPFQTEISLKYLGQEKMPDSDRLFKNFDLQIIGSINEE